VSIVDIKICCGKVEFTKENSHEITSYSFVFPEYPVISACLDVTSKRRYNKVIKMAMQQLNNLV